MCDSQPKTCGFHQKTNPIYILHSQTYDICICNCILWYMYIYIYMYMCMYIYIYMYVYVYIYVLILDVYCILHICTLQNILWGYVLVYTGVYIYIIVSYQYVMWNCQKREICIWLMMGWNGTAGCRQSHTYLGLKVPYLVMKGQLPKGRAQPPASFRHVFRDWISQCYFPSALHELPGFFFCTQSYSALTIPFWREYGNCNIIDTSMNMDGCKDGSTVSSS